MTASNTDQKLRWGTMLPRARQRFPYLQENKAPSPLGDREGFIAYLARSHHLTMREAREEAEDFLFIESLWDEVELQVG